MNYLGVGGGKDEKKGGQKAPRKKSCELDSQLFHKHIFKTGVERHYDAVLVSAVQCTYIYPLPLRQSLLLLPHLMPLGYHSFKLNSPCYTAGSH